MKPSWNVVITVVSLVSLSTLDAQAHSGPFDGKTFKGRIAFSSDGNFNDEDDWGAFPIAAAILDAFGVTDKLVHVDYKTERRPPTHPSGSAIWWEALSG